MENTERQIMSNDWADLPEELLDLIQSKLLDKYLVSFGLVCRLWNSVSRQSPLPCLVFNGKSTTSEDSVWGCAQYKDFYWMKFPKILNGAQICCSKDGWLLMSRLDDRSLFFFDPFNELIISNIPKSDCEYDSICFFNQPTSANCILIGLARIGWTEVKINVLNYGDDKWKSYKYSYFTNWDNFCSNCAPILHHQYLFKFDHNGDLSTFDINELGNESNWITACPCPSEFSGNVKEQYLIKLEAEQVLLGVFVSKYDEREVKLYKLDLMEWPECQEWEPVADLPDKVLFVSRTASFAANATDHPALKLMANKIFLPLFHEHGDNGVFYCLNTKKYHSYSGDYSSRSYRSLISIPSADWIMPTPRNFHTRRIMPTPRTQE